MSFPHPRLEAEEQSREHANQMLTVTRSEVLAVSIVPVRNLIQVTEILDGKKPGFKPRSVPVDFTTCVHVLSHIWLFATQWLFCPWKRPEKNTEMGCHFLLQGISLTRGSNLCLLHLLHWKADSFPLSHLGSHFYCLYWIMSTLGRIGHLFLTSMNWGSESGRFSAILKKRSSFFHFDLDPLKPSPLTFSPMWFKE